MNFDRLEFEGPLNLSSIPSGEGTYFIEAPMTPKHRYPPDIVKRAGEECLNRTVIVSHGRTDEYGNLPVGIIKEVRWNEETEQPIATMEMLAKTPEHIRIKNIIMNDLSKSYEERTFRGVSIGGYLFKDPETDNPDSLIIQELSLGFNPVCGADCMIGIPTLNDGEVSLMTEEETTPAAANVNNGNGSVSELSEKVALLEARLTEFDNMLKSREQQLAAALVGEQNKLDDNVQLAAIVTELEGKINDLVSFNANLMTENTRAEIVRLECGCTDTQEAKTRMRQYEGFSTEQLDLIIEGHKLRSGRNGNSRLASMGNPVQFDVGRGQASGIVGQKLDPQAYVDQVLATYNNRTNQTSRQIAGMPEEE